jgi:hypothetical protein
VLQARARVRAAVAQERQLRAALVQRQEQRQEQRAQEGPARDLHVGRDPARAEAQEEAAGDAEGVDQHDALQVQAVGDVEQPVGAHDGDRLDAAAAREGEPERAGEEQRGAHQRGGDRELAGGDRALALLRVRAVLLDVEHVVQQVDRARGQAEGGEGAQARQPVLARQDPAAAVAGGEGQRGQYEEVLRPLVRAHGPQERSRLIPPPEPTRPGGPNRA